MSLFIPCNFTEYREVNFTKRLCRNQRAEPSCDTFDFLHVGSHINFISWYFKTKLKYVLNYMAIHCWSDWATNLQRQSTNCLIHPRTTMRVDISPGWLYMGRVTLFKKSASKWGKRRSNMHKKYWCVSKIHIRNTKIQFFN